MNNIGRGDMFARAQARITAIGTELYADQPWNHAVIAVDLYNQGRALATAAIRHYRGEVFAVPAPDPIRVYPFPAGKRAPADSGLPF